MNQTRKKDRTYQAVKQDPMPEEWEAEFRRLRPLIAEEIRQGHKVELYFLRSAARSHRPLREARQARRLLSEKAVSGYLTRSAGEIAGAMDREITAWLTKGNLNDLIHPEETRGSVTESLMRSAFRRGIPPEGMDAASAEGNLEKALERKVYAAFPVLRHCGNLRITPGETGAEMLQSQIREGKAEVIRRLQAHFPQGRSRKHLKQNPGLQASQKERDRKGRDRKTLREALLKAIPAEMKDLYPLARSMRRRFVLHLGPTNSGKTWESIQRLQTAENGIYLGPLRLLAFEQFEGMNLADVPCSLVTGEECIPVPDSRVQSSTIALADLEKEYDIAVVDE